MYCTALEFCPSVRGLKELAKKYNPLYFALTSIPSFLLILVGVQKYYKIIEVAFYARL